ncbi:formylglycine-generating enzyme family protein [Stenomitos frigidus]|uniref:Formylglycine-generating enzyme family protein n=1 Tax=Stenomitos frigidus ULC18 TaxID=2107698 RepID=A0A2T1E0N2_9CYAN|nr:formylglycine-generating enzyme family protein [Stenomitos frigidus]PSB26315.1 formylglycine-generating enzyme family protein [Stenomitos frigidus ULC18]
MRRRRFVQYAGFGGVGLAVGLGNRSLAALSPTNLDLGSTRSNLQTFAFEAINVGRDGQENDRRSHQAQFFAEALEAGLTIDMVAISKGRFLMGAATTERSSLDSERPRRRVTVPAFFMSQQPVTQAQWRMVATLPRVKRGLPLNPSHFKGNDLPVESVSWFDAVEFCDRLSKHTGSTYRLPSEAEWEYACRAGTTTPFHFGETITSQLANYGSAFTYALESEGDYRQSTAPVDGFSYNAFGLGNMHGNVWEWCADTWHDSYSGASSRSVAWVNGGTSDWRSLRGGAWSDTPDQARSAKRSGYPAAALNRIIGFRVCCA